MKSVIKYIGDRMLSYEGVVWGFIIVAIVFIFVNSEFGKSLKFRIGNDGMQLQIENMIPEKGVPNSLKAENDIKPSTTFVSDNKNSEEKKDKYLNVALNKPVIYIPKRIITNQGEWNRDYYYERFSVNVGNYPSNLTDGNNNTVAYPASWFIDYVVDLEENKEIDEVEIAWKEFGKKGEDTYITFWKLLSQNSIKGSKPLEDGDWKIIKSSNSVDEEITKIVFDKPINSRRFRIYAESIDRKNGKLLNWIGVYEFKAIQKTEKMKD